MQVTKKNLSDTKIELTVVASAQQLQDAKKRTLDRLALDMKLPGFRPGKAPAALVEKNANPAALQTEFLDQAMNTIYGALIDSEKLRPVAQPKVDVKKFVPFDSLELVFEVEVVSAVVLPDYTKIKKSKAATKVTAADIDGVIAELKKRESEKKDVARAAQKGDQAWIDFKGVDTKTKEPIKGADGKDYPLPLGSGTFIPGFEEEVIGLKAGEAKTFTITFPKNYGVPSLQSRKVDFTVTVNKVQELVEPTVDDAFAAKVGPFKTVAELKDDVKKQLEAEQESQNERAFTDELLLEITKAAKVSIPESLVDEQIERLVSEQKQNLMYRGQTWQEFLDEQKLTEEAYRTAQRKDAELRVKAGLVLGEIAEKEKIIITPEELDMRIQILKGQYPDKQMQAELDKPESRREIASRLISEKTIHKLKSYVADKKVVKTDKPAAAKASEKVAKASK